MASISFARAHDYKYGEFKKKHFINKSKIVLYLDPLFTVSGEKDYYKAGAAAKMKNAKYVRVDLNRMPPFL